MAETAVLFALGEVFQFLKEETDLLTGIHRDFSDIKDELETIQVFLKDADRRAADEADTNDGIRTWVKHMREVSFRIEDVIDEYLWQIHRTDPTGSGSLVRKIPSLIKTFIPRHKIAAEIQNIKLSIRAIRERSERLNFQISHEQGSSSRSNGTGETENGRWCNPRLSSLFIEETEIVGLEGPREELLGWLWEGAAERTVISVVGMGGLGKTTLAKLVFDSQKVETHFDCRACITVSQSYAVREILIKTMEQFCEKTKDPLPKRLSKMDDQSLVIEVRKYLQHKRYLIFFDDVWQEDFSDQVELAMPNNIKGSRIIITTRMMQVADFFKKSFLVHVHNLQLLTPKKSWELFCKKAFRSEVGGSCPPELEALSKEIVQKFKPLPLAIVAIGGLLSAAKSKTMIERKKLSGNLSLELGRNAHLMSLKKILLLSYDSLPHYLKPCILYLRDTLVQHLPGEINKLTKLRHLLVFHRNYEAKYSLLGFTTGVRMERGIKNMTSLQNLYYVEVDHGGVDLIKELKMLRQLRRLGVRRVRREHGNALCAAIVEMKHLENLNVTTISEDEIIDLNFTSSPPQLQRLHLKARLQKLPNWIRDLEYLVEIKLALSKLKDDPLQSLKNLPNMQKFGLWDNAYDGEFLHFQNGGFLKLKRLDLSRLARVNFVLIDEDGKSMHQEDYHGKHQLFATNQMRYCLDGSPKQKVTSKEFKEWSFSPCRMDSNQIWELKSNGTLVNSYSGLCATVNYIEAANVGSGGVRSWIATGRRGEVYLAFFNLSDQQKTRIYTKTSYLAKVLPDRRINSCRGKEVWSGKNVVTIQGTIAMDVEVHGSALFVLYCI